MRHFTDNSGKIQFVKLVLCVIYVREGILLRMYLPCHRVRCELALTAKYFEVHSVNSISAHSFAAVW